MKVLYRKFRILDQPSIKIVFEFCEFDAVRTTKVLSMAENFKVPAVVVKRLVDYPEKSENYIEELC